MHPSPCPSRLHTLDLGADGSNELLPHLTLPALEHLHLTSVNSECVEAVDELVTRSRCSPTTLRVSFYEPESIEAMHDCISRAPSVRNLEMLCAGVTSADFSRLFDSISKDHSILPALTFFTIGECTAQIELRSLDVCRPKGTYPKNGAAKILQTLFPPGVSG
jgi:hypothetical protein